MELRLVVFQICSADPFEVVLVMGGFDSVPSPSASHRDGLRGNFCPPVLGILEKTQTERQEVARGMLADICLETLWNKLGLTCSSC